MQSDWMDAKDGLPDFHKLIEVRRAVGVNSEGEVVHYSNPAIVSREPPRYKEDAWGQLMPDWVWTHPSGGETLPDYEKDQWRDIGAKQ